MSDCYECSFCRMVFEKDDDNWSDEDAFEEAKNNWPSLDLTKEPLSAVCDDCYNYLITVLKK